MRTCFTRFTARAMHRRERGETLSCDFFRLVVQQTTDMTKHYFSVYLRRGGHFGGSKENCCNLLSRIESWKD